MRAACDGRDVVPTDGDKRPLLHDGKTNRLPRILSTNSRTTEKLFRVFENAARIDGDDGPFCAGPSVGVQMNGNRCFSGPAQERTGSRKQREGRQVGGPINPGIQCWWAGRPATEASVRRYLVIAGIPGARSNALRSFILPQRLVEDLYDVKGVVVETRPDMQTVFIRPAVIVHVAPGSAFTAERHPNV